MLSGCVITLGGALVSTLLYIWSGTKKKISSIETKVDKIAASLSTLATSTTTEIAVIKRICEERHGEYTQERSGRDRRKRFDE